MTGKSWPNKHVIHEAKSEKKCQLSSKDVSPPTIRLYQAVRSRLNCKRTSSGLELYVCDGYDLLCHTLLMAMDSARMSITTSLLLLATAWMIAGAAAVKDYTVSCTISSDSSPTWKHAHKAVNIIRKEPLSSQR
ncbi:hypothetical protein MPTK2_7g02620 [Marchantia polymorpha subsp. ruderalis]